MMNFQTKRWGAITLILLVIVGIVGCPMMETPNSDPRNLAISAIVNGSSFMNVGTAGNIETIDFAGAPSGVVFNMGSTMNNLKIAANTASVTTTNIENISGSNFDDVLIGNDKNNRINGNGSTTVDVYTGGSGNDIFVVNSGSKAEITDFIYTTDRIAFVNIKIGDNEFKPEKLEIDFDTTTREGKTLVLVKYTDEALNPPPNLHIAIHLTQEFLDSVRPTLVSSNPLLAFVNLNLNSIIAQIKSDKAQIISILEPVVRTYHRLIFE